MREERKFSESSSGSEESSSEEEEEKKEEDPIPDVHVKYDLITNLLVSFFSIHSRILEKSSTFEIGPIKFLVAGTSPHKLGKVTGETLIRCNQSASEKAELDYIEIIPMRRNQIQSRSQFVETYVNPYLQTLAPKSMYAFKHGIFELENL